MEVIYTLIPGMIFLSLLILGVLVWAVRKGQYEDFEGDSQRILMDDDDAANTGAKTKKPVNPNWPDADGD